MRGAGSPDDVIDASACPEPGKPSPQTLAYRGDVPPSTPRWRWSPPSMPPAAANGCATSSARSRLAPRSCCCPAARPSARACCLATMICAIGLPHPRARPLGLIPATVFGLLSVLILYAQCAGRVDCRELVTPPAHSQGVFVPNQYQPARVEGDSAPLRRRGWHFASPAGSSPAAAIGPVMRIQLASPPLLSRPRRAWPAVAAQTCTLDFTIEVTQGVGDDPPRHPAGRPRGVHSPRPELPAGRRIDRASGLGRDDPRATASPARSGRSSPPRAATPPTWSASTRNHVSGLNVAGVDFGGPMALTLFGDPGTRTDTDSPTEQAEWDAMTLRRAFSLHAHGRRHAGGRCARPARGLPLRRRCAPPIDNRRPTPLFPAAIAGKP